MSAGLRPAAGSPLGALVLSAGLLLSPLGGSAQEPDPLPPPAPGDSAGALEAFRSNIRAIHLRDRAAYLSHYLQSPRLVRSGPEGVQHGWESFAAGAGQNWPDTLVASHFLVTPLTDGVAHGSYHYRVVQGGESTRGVSERLLLRTPDGWRVAATSAFPSDPSLPPPPAALVGGTLVDGTGAPPVEDAVVILREGRIDCAGPAADCPVPDGAHRVDTRGHWIIPGLVDAHVHFSQTGWADGRPDALDLRDRHPYDGAVQRLRESPEAFFRAQLCSGVTSAFDVGGYPWTWDLRQRTEADPRAPRVRAAGPLLSTRDHWVNLPGERQFLYLADEETARSATDYLLAAGTDAVKVWYLRLDDAARAGQARELLELAGDRAAQAGVPLIVHATHLEGAKEALRAGAHLLVHSVENAAVDEEFLGLARAAGVVYTPTLTVYDGYRQLRERRFDESDLETDCVDARTLTLARSTRDVPGGLSEEEAQVAAERGRERARLMAENLRRVHEAGIPVAMGTDAGNPLTLHGPAVFTEMEAMHEAGLSPMEVLVASTLGGARAMGLEDQVGTLEAGKVGDLVVLGDDPLEDVRNLRAIRLVVRGGEIFTRDELAW
ncbi:MAG: amidohydrolase family protein [Acidobacteriota bacterium]